MKITLDPNDIPQIDGFVTGTYSFASFNRIVKTMIEAQELILCPGEYVEKVVISSRGLSFLIEKES